MIRVVGFSARCLAQAATAAGLEVFAIDAFGDKDLEETTVGNCIVDWPPCSSMALDSVVVADKAGFVPGKPAASSKTTCNWHHPSAQVNPTPAIVVSLESAGSNSDEIAPILLAGGTENWSARLAELHRKGPVFGPTLEQMQLLRNPQFWRECVESCPGIDFPATSFSPQSSPSTPGEGRLLQKTVDSAGGMGVSSTVAPADTALNGDTAHSAGGAELLESGRNRYFQRFVRGASIGITLVLYPSPRKCRVLGATESWNADDVPGPTEFIYRGSWGPIRITTTQHAQLLHLADCIRSRVGAIGWLQMDFIQDEAQEKLWLLEMNPRWTSGMEVLARAGRKPVEHHLGAWNWIEEPDEGKPKDNNSQNGECCEAWAKCVFYAPRDLRLNSEQIARIHGLNRKYFADLPNAAPSATAVTIEKGHPMLTVLAAHDGPAVLDRSGLRSQLLEILRKNLRHVEEIIADPKI
ncbi:MAG: hypothetical protein AAF483_26975 [Planctomycetota bacterium]